MKYLFFTILLIFSTILNGEQLKFKSFIDYVLKNNYTIVSKVIDKKISKLNEKKTTLSYLPTIDLSTNFIYDTSTEMQQSKNSSFSNNFGIDVSQFKSYNPTWSRSLSVSLPIFLGNSRYYSKKIAQEGVKIADIDHLYQIQYIKTQAAVLFFNTYISQNKLILFQEAIELAKKNKEITKTLFDNDRATQLDVDSIDLALKERELAFEQGKLNIENQFSELSTVANRSIDVQKLIIDIDIEKIIKKFKNNVDIKDYVNKMVQNSPLLKKFDHLFNVDKYNLDLNYSNFLPNIILSYNYDFGTSENLFGEGYREPSNRFMISFSWNIFNQFTDMVSYKKTKLENQKNIIEYQNLKSEQTKSLKQILNSLKSLSKQRDIVKLAIDVADSLLEKVKLKYKMGKVDYLELMESENRYLEKKNQLIEIDGSILVTYYQLLVLIGYRD